MGRATATLFFLAAAEGAAAASSNTTNPLKCYTGALGAKFESTCDADVKHCIIHIMKLGESYFCGGSRVVGSYECTESLTMKECVCSKNLCNVNNGGSDRVRLQPLALAVATTMAVLVKHHTF